MPPLRVGQANGHGNCKKGYSESLQHGFILPRFRQQFQTQLSRRKAGGPLNCSSSFRAKSRQENARKHGSSARQWSGAGASRHIPLDEESGSEIAATAQ